MSSFERIKNTTAKFFQTAGIIRVATFLAVLGFAGILLPKSLSASNRPLIKVPYVDLQRYMGDWNVIALLPNFIEKNCIRSVESYALRSDGKIDNWFVCTKADGTTKKLTSVASVRDCTTNARWSIRFNWDSLLGKIPAPFRFAYYIIDLDLVDYNYAVVGHPNRKYLWIMARGHELDADTYEKILTRAKEQGFDTSKIVKLSHK